MESKTIYNLMTFTDDHCLFINEFLNKKIPAGRPMDKTAVAPLIKDFKKVFGLTISWQVIDKYAFSHRRRELDPNMRRVTSARGGWVLMPGAGSPLLNISPEEKAEADRRFAEYEAEEAKKSWREKDNLVTSVTELEDAHCLAIHEALEKSNDKIAISRVISEKFGIRIYRDIVDTFAKSARRTKIAAAAAAAAAKSKPATEASSVESPAVADADCPPATKKSRKETAKK